ncbi:MAG: hypothetical protein WCD31_08790 [Gillisia sp.]
MEFKHKMLLTDAVVLQHYHANAKRLNHIFLTLTQNPESYDNTNKSVSRFMDNIVKNYGVTSYVWVREITDSFIPHYHVTLSAPYLDPRKLNKAWCKSRGSFSPNALRSSSHNTWRITNLEHSVRYITKYMGKATKGQLCCIDRKIEGHSNKVYGISSNLRIKPIDFEYYYLRRFSRSKESLYDWAKMYRVSPGQSMIYFKEIFGDFVKPL